MAHVTLIIGLPGSGKTYLAKTQYAGHHLVDDPQDLQQVFSALHLHDKVVICDPHLCRTSTRLAANHLLRECVVSEVFFQNDPDACILNARRRQDHRDVESLILLLSPLYQPPEDALPVWRPVKTDLGGATLRHAPLPRPQRGDP